MATVTGQAVIGGTVYPVTAAVTLPPAGFPAAAATGPAAGGFTPGAPQPGGTVPGASPPPWCVKQPDGSWLISGRTFTSPVVLNAGNVTIQGCRFTIGGGAFWAVEITKPGVTIAWCEISGATSAPADRISIAIQGAGNSGVTVRGCNIYWCRQCVGAGGSGLAITGNYFHDLVAQSGDHSECVYLAGGAQNNVTVAGNTLLNPLGQTAALFMDNTSGGLYDGVTITGNLLAGGDYALYGGVAKGGTVRNEVITGNAFSVMYLPNVGVYGPVADTGTGTAGYAWAGNYYHDGPKAGQPVSD